MFAIFVSFITNDPMLIDHLNWPVSQLLCGIGFGFDFGLKCVLYSLLKLTMK